ncbi:uncharacterized protein LOC123904283 [Trifolium pratense]|uniref:uncharacterized protein LOC123904283 n=1 Tax=Trifolium pratense TaxID=57577 RepID=UPI001E6910E1|nr:uncharacterized protein LOC123904283 [Trifolium pratense]
MPNEVEEEVVEGRSGKEKDHEGEVENERNGELEEEVENESEEKKEKSKKERLIDPNSMLRKIKSQLLKEGPQKIPYYVKLPYPHIRKNKSSVSSESEKKVKSENEKKIKSKILKDGEKAQVVLPREKLPYPHKKKSKRKDINFKKFMEMFNSLQVTIPFMESLEQMPMYAKFMKELLTKKRQPKEDETVLLTEECSSILQRKLPQKKKDPGSFTISCSIGNLHVGRALCDLGASINLMSLSMMKKIPGAVAKPTRMQLSLADRSITYPYGILQDVLVRVAEFVFPADFVILDMEENAEMPLLLGRPFLATGRALIDVEMDDLMLRLNDEQVNFNIFEGIRNQDVTPQCFKVDVIEDEIGNSKKEATKSISLDLKALPPNWKYVFLGDGCKQPVIISSLLTPLEEEKILKYLKKDDGVMGWNLNGVIPAFCLHKLKNEEDSNSVVPSQELLTTTLEDLVKNDVMKIFEIGLMSIISDSFQVNSVHVGPKREVSMEDSKEAPKRLKKKKRKKWKHKLIKFVSHPVIEKLLLFDRNVTPLKREEKRRRGKSNLKYPP